MLHISPGVYVSIVDQSEFINAVPVTTVFTPFFSDKGIDNTLVFLNGQKTLRTSFMVSDFAKQGKNFREGYMCMDRWLSISGSAYGMRLLPTGATYANLLYAIDESVVGKPKLTLTALDGVNSVAELDTLIGGSTLVGIKPVALYSAYARGEYYNNVSINITQVINEDDTYLLDIYEVDANGDKIITATHKISFIENKIDLDGETIYAEDVLKKFSELVNVRINQDNFALLADFETVAGVESITNTPPASPIEGQSVIIGIAPTGAFATHANEIARYTTGAWVFTAPARGYVVKVGTTEPVQYLFDGDEWFTFDAVQGMFSAASSTDFDYKDLANGSSGDLYNAQGIIDTEVAKQLLAKAYSGLIDDKVLNTEYVYFPFVMCPYPLVEVSDAAVALAKLYRMDCFTFTTLPDSVSANADIQEKQDNYTYNTYMAALYGNYSRVYNMDMGKNIWVSPIYHMARVMPYTVSVASIADAPAGFDRAMCEEAKELRYQPLVGDRDNLYVDRINYLCKFRNGTCIWQQLTSQMKDSSLSDINVVNVVLYIKRIVATFCMNFIYYRNVPETHERISKAIDEFLKDMKDRGWIQNYAIDVGASPYEYKKKVCHVNIILWPTKVIEKIEITQYIR